MFVVWEFTCMATSLPLLSSPNTTSITAQRCFSPPSYALSGNVGLFLSFICFLFIYAICLFPTCYDRVALIDTIVCAPHPLLCFHLLFLAVSHLLNSWDGQGEVPVL